MADITNLFKATLKTVKSRLKSQGVKVEPDKSILGRSKKASDFGTKANQVVGHITTLRDYLLQHRKDYINTAGHLGDARSSMTDTERDQIDSEAEKVMKACREAIKAFKSEALSGGGTGQEATHRNEIFRLIDVYLKGVCQIYSSQRAVRVKRTVDRKRISRLQPESQRAKSAKTFVSRLDDEKKEPGPNGEKEKEKEKEKENEAKPSKAESSSSRLPVLDMLLGDEEEEPISAEDMQMLEAENEQLYREMNSLVDEVRQIEGKVVEISKLQEIFSEKVLEQEVDIDGIANTVVGATENIKEANEDIREAMKNNAGLRVWILFFLIVCTLSLLFLDWYNP